MNTPRQTLRALLDQPGIVVAPGVYDSLMARLVERAGFPAVYLTGAGIANSMLGQPDIGLLSLTEMVTRATYVSDAVGIPVIADADTGYGNAMNAMRTVKEFERAGVAALQLEDQVTPKRCGHMGGKEVVPTAEMVGKLRAALDARTDPSLLIIARTDARAPLGLTAAIERGALYAEEGADVVFVEAPQTVEEMRLITASIHAPLMANMVEGGKTPLLNAPELEEIGYKLVIFPGAIMRRITRAAAEMLDIVKREGGTRSLLDQMYSWKEVNDIVDFPSYQALEARYLGGS
jgi:2,3-dimethylmalate lyase